jgi:hypothetical protein
MVGLFRRTVLVLPSLLLFMTQDAANPGQNETIVRVSEIEIDPNYLEQYNAILKEEAEPSVRLEVGVVSIFPMHEKEYPSGEDSGDLRQSRSLRVAPKNSGFSTIQSHHAENGQIAKPGRYGGYRPGSND